eukprot:10086864-Lingulodinium_polyedra.AAC.1
MTRGLVATRVLQAGCACRGPAVAPRHARPARWFVIYAPSLVLARQVWRVGRRTQIARQTLAPIIVPG